MKVIGIDMGTNSIGWAVIEDHKILSSGVRVFPEGVNRPKGSYEESKNLKRRLARQIRRQYFRRRLRKATLTKILKAHGMFPNEQGLTAWNGLNPYELRAKATEEHLTPLEFGRVMFHMAQRRGFKSSLKGSDSEEGKIYDGDLKLRKPGITATQQAIKSEGFATLGAYLNSLDTTVERIRNRYTTRKMYQHEFEVIWDVQKSFDPQIYTPDLYDLLGHEKKGVLFFQRPLRSQKSLIGKCTFEKGKPKIPISHPDFQEYRAWSFINNIRYGNNERLTKDQNQVVFNEMMTKPTLKISQIKKKLKLQGEEFNYDDDTLVPCMSTLFQLNKHFGNKVDFTNTKELEDLWHLFYHAEDPEWLTAKVHSKYGLDPESAKAAAEGKPRVRLDEGYGSLSSAAIKRILPFLRMGIRYDLATLLAGVRKVLGESYWESLNENDIQALIDNVRHALLAKESGKLRERLWAYLSSEFTIDERYSAADLYHHSDLDTQQDLLDALPEPKNLRNPIVQQALYELKSLVNALLKNFGPPDRIALEMARELKSPKKVREKMLDDNRKREKQRMEIKQNLINEGIRPSSANITKYLLWEECGQQCPYTGMSISRQDLFDDGVWQVEHIIPYSVSFDDGFNNKTLCYADENRNKGNKTPWQFYNYNPNKWEEVKARAKHLFCNRNSYPKFLKFVNESDPKADEFLERQLNDTRYMAKEAKSYLAKVCKDILVTPGGVTAELRHLWGLNGILAPPIRTEYAYEGLCWLVTDPNNKPLHLEPWEMSKAGKIEEKLSKQGVVWEGELREGTFYSKKIRDDHRHHAVDAIAIACTERNYVTKISSYNALDWRFPRPAFEKPWASFFEDAKESVESILVSHKVRNRLITKRTLRQRINGKKVVHHTTAPRGQMHEETFYGLVRDPASGTDRFTTRKPLGAITKVKQLKGITDSRILRLIEERAHELGVDLSNKDLELPKNFFFEYSEEGIPTPTLYLPGGAYGRPIPVRKIRYRVESGNMKLRNKETNQYAEPGNNFMAVIIEDTQGNLREEIVSFWDAVTRQKDGHPPVILLEGEKIMYNFQANEMYLLNLPEGTRWQDLPAKTLSKHLYRVQKFSSMFFVFRLHSASTLKYENEFVRVQSFSALIKLNPLPISSTYFGLNGL